MVTAYYLEVDEGKIEICSYKAIKEMMGEEDVVLDRELGEAFEELRRKEEDKLSIESWTKP